MSRALRRIGPVLGFTLVELLVVIGVIMLLMGILMPTLQSAAAKGKETKCLSNLRQISQTLLAYRINYRDFLPSPAHAECMDTDAKLDDATLYDGGVDAKGNQTCPWRGKLIPFIGAKSDNEDERYAVLKCPSVRDFKGKRSFYGINAYVGMFTGPERAKDNDQFKYVHAEDFVDPAETLLIGENNSGHWAVKPQIPVSPADFNATCDPAKNHARHAGRGVWVYADGHARPLRIAESEERNCYLWLTEKK